MAAISPPLVDFSDAAFNCPPHPSIELFSPHHRPDTPQLTLHDYHKFQQSPLLSESPGPEYRRVRRRPSVANLAVTSAHAGFWTSPSLSAPPHFIHSLAHPSLDLSSLPLPPTTPRPRPTTASPSLSSTVTTLQSTPTHTPVFRGGSHFEQRRVNERVELVEPIRTKRKFDSLKQAKRLPRRAAGGGGNESSERDGELWEVFAVVIAPTEGYQDLEESVDLSEESDGQDWLQPAPLFSQQIATGGEKRRAVHFEAPYSTEEFYNEGGLPGLYPTTSTWPLEEKETTATSSYSLSKFQFPVPPGLDNWTGAVGHHSEPNSPSTPATLHYRGASFDVVNPHESLLLETHTFETPAEIDGLLDDYFHTKPEINDMAHNELTGEASQSSLRMGSDNSRHARVLYEDPDSARRHILNKQDELSTPPKAILNDSSLTNKSDVAKPMEEDGLASMPTQQLLPKPNSNPFRGLPSIARVMGFVPSNSSGQPDGQVAKIGDSRPFINDASFGDMKGNLSPSDSGQLKSQQGSLRRVTHCSDPFDLTLSESESHANLMTIDEAMKDNKSAENVPNIAQGADTVDAPKVGGGAVSQAIYAEQESDPTIKEIIGSYDYTRVPSSPEKDESAQDSLSIEHGRGTTGNNDKRPTPMAHLPLAGQAASTTAFQREDEMKTPDSAVAMAPACGGGHVHTNCTDLRSSDQTYGETNQLLQITPKTPGDIYTRHPEVVYPPYPGPQSNPFVDGEYVVQSGPPSSRSTATVIHRKRDSEVPPQFRFFDTDEERDAAHRPLPRSSSVYPFDKIFDDPAGDDESVWETEVSKSSAAIPRVHDRHSEDNASYADTSACDPESRVSVGPEMFLQYGCFPNKAPMPRARPSQRTKFEAPPDAPADETDNVRDTQKAISLLSDKIVTEAMASKDGSCPHFDKEQRRLDLEELERLRTSNPGAIREASEFLANRSLDKVKDLGSKAQAKLLKMKALKLDHKRENIFKKAKTFGKGPSSTRSDSDHRFLLGTPDSAIRQNNLMWDESEGDFVTVRSEKTPGIWSPFAENTTEQALRMPSPAVSHGVSATSSRNAIDLGRPGKKLKGKRLEGTAMSSQIELRELKLQSGRKNTPRGRGLTDAELVRREPGWSLQPKRFASSPLVNSISRNTQPVDPNPTNTQSATPQQPDIELQPVRPTLAHGGQAQTQRELPYLETKDEVSRNYAMLCMIFPGLSLVYALGGFDGIMRKKTHGVIAGMNPRMKRYALYLHFPLVLMFWVIVAIIIFTLIEIFKNIDTNNPPGPCTDPISGFALGAAGDVCPPV